MATTSAEQFRARATQARRIAENMHGREGQIELGDMANALDAEADRLESCKDPNPTSQTDEASEDGL